MNKILSALIVSVALLSLSFSASAQGAFDIFGGTRTVVVAPPQTILTSANATVTNTPVDIHMFQGVGKLDLFAQTNSAGTLTVNVQQSSDETNWTALTNYALATPTSVISTNQSGSSVAATNTFLEPGTITVPVAGTAGYATPNLLAAAFTNSGAITMSGSNVVSIGFNTDDALRYIRTIWTPAGTVTNVAVAAILTGRYRTNPLIP